MEYHFTIWSWQLGPFGETMTLFLMLVRVLVDILSLIWGFIMATLGFVFHIGFLITEIIFLSWPEGWYEYLRFLGFPNA